MAGAGYKDWTAGDTVTADQVDTYLMEQSVMVFADAAARDAALSAVKSEGMTCYIKDITGNGTGGTCAYDGSAWRITGSDWENYSPTWENITLGAATVSGRFCHTPGGMNVRSTIAFAADTSVVGQVFLRHPGSVSMRDDSSYAVGSVVAQSSSSIAYPGCISLYANQNYGWIIAGPDGGYMNTTVSGGSWPANTVVSVSYFLPL
jgi:hypothetical protein